MIEEYPEIALERFDKANIWIKYIIIKIKKFLKDDILEVGAGCGSFTKSYISLIFINCLILIMSNFIY